MNDYLDLSRVRARSYRAQWRFVIECPDAFENKSYYYYHYLGTNDVNRPSRWTRFISQIMSTKLSRTDIKDTLPMIRDVLPVHIKFIDLHPLLTEYDAPLTRSLFDVAIIFDIAPHDLKTFIVTCFGVDPYNLQEFLDTREKVA